MSLKNSGSCQTECSSAVFGMLLQAESFYETGSLVDACAMYQSAISKDNTESARVEFGSFLLQIDCPSAAIEQFSKALNKSRQTKNHRLRSVVCNNLAVAFRQQGYFELAVSYQQQSLAAANVAIGTRNIGITSSADLSNLANDAIRKGDLFLAEELLQRSLALEADACSLKGQASDLGSLGVVAILKREPEQALEYLWRAHRLHRRVNDHNAVGCDLLNLAEAYRHLGCCEDASRCLRLAILRFEKVHATGLIKKTKRLQRNLERIDDVYLRDPLLN
ncbi:hypothetical protein MNBD_PLANCTO02-557 [hydrothermal vent metagenome]|uniref:MalT-like TPR region domain-containing protein n=1 Tax=hydrothermal vent metagenome TaxID=652676 RepID=A0A3B1D8J0_9ZZZZ